MTHYRLLTPALTAAALALAAALAGVMPGPGPGGVALAQKKSKSALAPYKTTKQHKKVRKSYEACRKDALASLKKGAISKKKFEIALNACNESFPGASLYTTCKKSAVKRATRSNEAPEAAVAECKRFLVAASFDPDNPVPYFVDNGQLYFAGIGLNRPMPVSSLRPPNFDCGKLAAVARNPEEALYLLFGNHPRVFAGLGDKKGPALVQTLKLPAGKTSEKGTDVPGFGRVFGDPKAASGVVFFPAGSCDFDSEPGDMLAGLSAYYLIDAENSGVTPYFGIAYFKQDQSKITTPKLVQAMIKELGPNFKPFKKNAQTTFVAASPVTETDDDKDPKNLCKQPRSHRFVGIVQGRKDEPASPEFVVLANIRNLCDFGDRLAKRLTE